MGVDALWTKVDVSCGVADGHKGCVVERLGKPGVCSPPTTSVIGCIQRRARFLSLAYPRDRRPRPQFAPLLQSARVVHLYCQMTQVNTSLSSFNIPSQFLSVPFSHKQSLSAIIC